MGLDVIWTAEFAEAGWIRPWPADQSRRATQGRLLPAVKSGTYRNRLYAAPLNSNAQMLWYRTDLTKQPPSTWDEMMASATQLEKAGKPHLIQAQGQRYEGLVVWFTSLLASAGGTVLDRTGTKVALPTGPTERALDVMKRFSTSSVSDPALSTAREDEARLSWEAGKSAYMVNYSFVWPSANSNAPDLAAKMRWARYPGVSPSRPSRVTIGGFNLGIASYSRHPGLAFEAALCLSNDENQIKDATAGGLLPVTERLYDDPRLVNATTEATDSTTGKTKKIRAFPYADVIRDELRNAVQRPQTPYYNDVALAISRTLHPTRGIDPKKDVQRLRDAISKALKGEGLL
jgi:multiple sugar transport system substrate-binding protein